MEQPTSEQSERPEEGGYNRNSDTYPGKGKGPENHENQKGSKSQPSKGKSPGKHTETSKGKGSGEPVDHHRQMARENPWRKKVENDNASETIGDDGRQKELLQKAFRDAFVMDGTVFKRQHCKLMEVWYERENATVRIWIQA